MTETKAKAKAKDYPADLPLQIENLLALGSPAALTAAGVYRDVIDGKLAFEDAEAEMDARETGVERE